MIRSSVITRASGIARSSVIALSLVFAGLEAVAETPAADITPTDITRLPDTAPATTLVVSVSGIRNDKGQILIQLWRSSDGFLRKDTKADRTLVAIDANRAVGGIVTTTFSVAPGTYAVSIMHDENKSGKMDTNFVGYPKEGYGISNNAIGFMGPPSFDLARFNVLAAGKQISIVTRY